MMENIEEAFNRLSELVKEMEEITEEAGVKLVVIFGVLDQATGRGKIQARTPGMPVDIKLEFLDKIYYEVREIWSQGGEVMDGEPRRTEEENATPDSECKDVDQREKEDQAREAMMGLVKEIVNTDHHEEKKTYKKKCYSHPESVKIPEEAYRRIAEHRIAYKEWLDKAIADEEWPDAIKLKAGITALDILVLDLRDLEWGPSSIRFRRDKPYRPNEKERSQGWGVNTFGNKIHYYVHTHSLCGRWPHYEGTLEPDPGPRPEQCKDCRKKLDIKGGGEVRAE